MLTIGTSFAWDVYKNILRPSASDREVLLVSKVAIVLGAGGTLLLAINPPEMLAWLIWMGIGVMLATFAVPLLAGLYWRGATGQGAIASMVVGLVASGIFGYYSKFVGSLPVHFSLYALVLSAVAMVAVSLMTAKNSAEILDSTRTGWFIQPPGQPSRAGSPGETWLVDQDSSRQQ
jgi:SSS family solute:Na+ symporter